MRRSQRAAVLRYVSLSYSLCLLNGTKVDVASTLNEHFNPRVHNAQVPLHHRPIVHFHCTL